MNRTTVLWLLTLTWTAAGASAQPKRSATPVLFTADEECQLHIDGEDQGKVAGGGIKKAELVAGEHLVSAECVGGGTWQETITVGQEQKVVRITPQAASAAPGQPAPATPKSGSSGCVLIFDDTKPAVGRWLIGAIVEGGPCERSGVKLGSLVLSFATTKAKDLTPELLAKLGAKPVGSKLDWELLNPDGEVQKVATVLVAEPATGMVKILLADGRSARAASFDAAHPLLEVLRQTPPPGATLATTEPPATVASTKPAGRRCAGSALACNQRSGAGCGFGSGCTLTGLCGGFAAGSCFGKNQFTCGMTAGCFWQSWSKSCGGTGPSCAGQLSRFACSATPGCAWTETCWGSPTPCSSLNEAQCAQHPGCALQ